MDPRLVVHTCPSTVVGLEVWLEWQNSRHESLALPHWDHASHELKHAHAAWLSHGVKGIAVRFGQTVPETGAPSVVHVAWSDRAAASTALDCVSPSGGLFVTLAEIIAVCEKLPDASIWHVDTLPAGTAAACLACSALADLWSSTGGTYRVAYHGTTASAAAAITKARKFQPSESGMMGPGVYLGGFHKAARFAMFNSTRLNPGAPTRAPPKAGVHLPAVWEHEGGAVARVLVDLRDARICSAMPRVVECQCAECVQEALASSNVNGAKCIARV